ncbi:MAG: RNA polymerase sigma factor [Alistipes sp.]|nr:RNA polymerase sigma factor [Alistipes sp.]
MKSETQYIEFVSELRNTLYRLALSITSNSAEAEDIVQDVFERIWRARDKVLNSAFPRAYACRIAHNLAIDRQRTSARRQVFDLNEKVSGSNDGYNSADLTDMASLTRRIISSLPDKQRLTIHLRDVEGYDIEEIAEVLGMDEANVRMNLSRARKSVRDELTKLINYGVKQN